MFKKVLYISLAALAYLSTPYSSASGNQEMVILEVNASDGTSSFSKKYHVIATYAVKVNELKKEIEEVIKQKENQEINNLTTQLFLHIEGQGEPKEVDMSSDKKTVSEIIKNQNVREGYKLSMSDMTTFAGKKILAIEDLTKLPKNDKIKLLENQIYVGRNNGSIAKINLQPVSENYVRVYITEQKKLILVNGIDSLSEATIESIKKKIQEQTGILVENQKLLLSIGLSTVELTGRGTNEIKNGALLMLEGLTDASQDLDDSDNDGLSSLNNDGVDGDTNNGLDDDSKNNSTSNPLNNTNTNTGKLSFGKGTILVICVVVAVLTAIAVIMQKKAIKRKNLIAIKAKSTMLTKQKLNDAITTQV